MFVDTFSRGLLFASCLLWCSLSSAQSFSQLVIFGDSLSDTGNIAGILPTGLPPPYFENRISNGPLAVDTLAQALNLDAAPAADGGSNYAIVGGNILGNDFADLSSQLTRYLVDAENQADPNALYLLFMGGNDST